LSEPRLEAGGRAPDYIDPVHGWRTWLIVQGHDGVRLASVSFPALWPSRRRLAAECGRGFHTGNGPPLPVEHAAPSLDCSCGIYATSDLDRATQIADCATARFRDCLGRPVLGAALGEVSLWGTVVECSHGWRAGFAYPSRVYVLAPSYGRRAQVASADDLAAELAVYGVPVEVLECRSSLEIRRLFGAGDRADRAA
jgi:hypothetical protein